MAATLMMIGTRKGLWLARSDEDRESWEVDGPQFLMNEIYSCAIDTRRDQTAAARRRDELALRAAGVPLRRPRRHLGRDAQRRDPLPRGHRRRARAGVAARAGPPAEPDVVYAGTQPSALFRSEDRGETFEMVRSLLGPPAPRGVGCRLRRRRRSTRSCRTTTTPSSMTVAMSTGGVYQTRDGGSSWHPPTSASRPTSCPTRGRSSASACTRWPRTLTVPERMYPQNHHGVYRTDDGGRQWVSIADGLPSDFGFPIVVDPNDADTVYVFPLVADGERIPPEAKPRVWRSADARRVLDRARQRAARGRLLLRVMRDAMMPTTGARPASTSAPATARSSPATTRPTPGSRSPSTSPT